MRGRFFATSVMATALLLAASGTASASETLSGSRSCPTGQVAMRSYGTGYVIHQAPSGTTQAAWSNGSVATVRSSVTGYRSTTYRFNTTDDFINSQTYAFCTGI